MAWSWRVETASGDPVAPDLTFPTFSSQSDAETWIGEIWRELADLGAGRVTLLNDDHVVYGPMSLEEG